jgi:hypothetical protein
MKATLSRHPTQCTTLDIEPSGGELISNEVIGGQEGSHRENSCAKVKVVVHGESLVKTKDEGSVSDTDAKEVTTYENNEA